MSIKKELSRQQRKAKKRAAEEQILDVPRDLEPGEEVQSDAPERPKTRVKKRKRDTADEETIVTSQERSKKAKKGKKEKKHQKAKESEADMEGDEAQIAVDSGIDSDTEGGVALCPSIVTDKSTTIHRPIDDEEPPMKKGKKERKAEARAAKLAAEAAGATVSQAVATSPVSPKSKSNNRNRDKKRKEAAAAAESSTAGKAARFIVFVGNLPFTATTASITAHFAKLKPISVRNLTQKDDPSKSKGIAFVEFANYDTHKTALKVMHHSTFDDGRSEPRKINVELTVGGGGKKDERQAKIRSKNQRLEEQRIRRAHEEAKAKSAKATGTAKTDAAGHSNDIHPSRRNMVPT